MHQLQVLSASFKTIETGKPTIIIGYHYASDKKAKEKLIKSVNNKHILYFDDNPKGWASKWLPKDQRPVLIKFKARLKNPLVIKSKEMYEISIYRKLSKIKQQGYDSLVYLSRERQGVLFYPKDQIIKFL